MLKYAYFDGDNIGNSIDNLLKNKRIQDATHLSESIKNAIFEIERIVDSLNDVELLIAGGDDIFIRYDSETYNYDFLKKIPDIFYKYTGLSMSCGVGDSIQESIGNLVIAKSQDKGSIKGMDMRSNEQDKGNKRPKLFIFTTSNDPDPYINVIAHFVANNPNFIQIILVGVTVDRGKIEDKKIILKNLRKNIKEKLTYLSQKKYLKLKHGEKPKIKEIEINSAASERYAILKDINFDLQVIVYKELEKEITTILNSSDSFSYLFDVTGFLKKYLVDLYIILRFKNISEIYSFEFVNPPDYDNPDLNLIHNLIDTETYHYSCLSKSEYTKDKIILSNISVVSEKKYNQLISTFNILEKIGMISKIKLQIVLQGNVFFCIPSSVYQLFHGHAGLLFKEDPIN